LISISHRQGDVPTAFNDRTTDAVTLEAEHRHKAQVESGMRELKENFGLAVLRKHGFLVRPAA